MIRHGEPVESGVTRQSEEGKKTMTNWQAKAADFLEDLTGDENDSSMVNENKTKTETNGN